MNPVIKLREHWSAKRRYNVYMLVLTDFATSKAICADPPPMSRDPTVLLRGTSDTLSFKPADPVTQTSKN